MNLTKREELIALGSALYLLGIEFGRQSTEFATLEKRFLELKEQMGKML